MEKGLFLGFLHFLKNFWKYQKSALFDPPKYHFFWKFEYFPNESKNDCMVILSIFSSKNDLRGLEGHKIHQNGGCKLPFGKYFRVGSAFFEGVQQWTQFLVMKIACKKNESSVKRVFYAENTDNNTLRVFKGH